MMGVQEAPARLFMTLILRRMSLRSIYCAKLIGLPDVSIYRTDLGV